MWISSISDAIECPVRLVYTLNLGIKNLQNSNNNDYKKTSDTSNDFRNDANLSGITKGIVFECSIQYIMISKYDSNSVFEEVMDWFYDITDHAKRSLNQTVPPWDGEWIKDERVLNHKLESNSWDKLYSAVHEWYNGNKPWDGQEMNWVREKRVKGRISLDGKFIDLSGRIDLYASGENEDYVVELKHTKQNQLPKAMAQASLYVKLLESKNKNTNINGFVYHSLKGVIEAFTDEDWQQIISEGNQEHPRFNPNIFVCEKCPNFNCSERNNDGRKM